MAARNGPGCAVAGSPRRRPRRHGRGESGMTTSTLPSASSICLRLSAPGRPARFSTTTARRGLRRAVRQGQQPQRVAHAGQRRLGHEHPLLGERPAGRGAAAGPERHVRHDDVEAARQQPARRSTAPAAQAGWSAKLLLAGEDVQALADRCRERVRRTVRPRGPAAPRPSAGRAAVCAPSSRAAVPGCRSASSSAVWRRPRRQKPGEVGGDRRGADAAAHAGDGHHAAAERGVGGGLAGDLSGRNAAPPCRARAACAGTPRAQAAGDLAVEGHVVAVADDQHLDVRLQHLGCRSRAAERLLLAADVDDQRARGRQCAPGRRARCARCRGGCRSPPGNAWLSPSRRTFSVWYRRRRRSAAGGPCAPSPPAAPARWLPPSITAPPRRGSRTRRCCG